MSVTTSTAPAGALRPDLRAGALAMAQLLPAFVPFGLLVGASVAASADPLSAWLGTWAIYGGAAHVAVLEVLRQGSGWVAAAVVGLLVNLRLGAYAVSMVPQWRDAPLRRRLAAAVMLTDAPWALARGRAVGDEGSGPRGTQGYYLGAAVTLFVAWPVLVTTGMLVGDLVSSLPVATLLVPLTLGGVVAPQLADRPTAAAATAAALVAAGTTGWDPGLAAVLCAVVGVAVLAAFTVRAVLAHRDPEVAAPALLAVACLGLTLLVAVRGHPVVAAVAAGAGLYVVVAPPWF
ncbi:AzlC family ABC transporter permease [Nocardioides caldifontis]|uniref:AzlC family ABC transporter permease n=1 Tax=Nocardioides caldifontis TaxID=2588938 RepID=UPI0011E014FD|nr:AzlC family ABC transporter permease [Nocardioides caldifontis]